MTDSSFSLFKISDSQNRLAFSFHQCDKCGALSFPANTFGCHQCGAHTEDGHTISRPGKGVLRTAITVYADICPALKAPYVIGEIELAPGLIEEAVLDVGSEDEVHPGMLMEAVYIPDIKDKALIPCRFRPTGNKLEMGI
ncbi:hypothetical protein ERD78_03465 [Allopusillimonas soli]|uniref:OB-fold domain-containing protein n=1 Tax=Allopusillimonas soli TaxID=659016 RepID=A0A853F7G8_9BURK|nr:OB-fold domain-containing protein [Allopusillimonas soli]NYT35919.1 OB-fold domain-containing protein [Allopusillimonas soli]TEA76276.1 hypothetical protein ERD78_03465 [Allopusillimonas soli]